MSAHSDLFFGLINPIGVSKTEFMRSLRDEATLYGYSIEEIRLSHLLRGIYPERKLETESGIARYRTHMKAGTDLCISMKDASSVAALGIFEIKERRKSSTRPTIYLINSLKRRSEIKLFRKIYEDLFIGIALHATREERVDQLEGEFAAVPGSDTRHRADAEEVIEIDESEEFSLDDHSIYGQDVRDSVPMADFFVTVSNPIEVRKSVGRFMSILFGSPSESPTRDELAMFHAKASATRSIDLSRQVGAVISDDDGQIVSTGCNEVPKAGGGLYWAGDYDMRDYRRGYDPNSKLRNELLVELFGRLAKRGWLAENYKSQTPDQLVEAAADKRAGILHGSRVDRLVEYGRIVHAEMAAITEAARSGRAVAGLSLFCTTFPCHMCARHIVASGIKRVVYIEPYPKSLAKGLYADSILLDPIRGDPNHVSFVPFDGVAPRFYLRAFEKGRRKDASGNAITWFKTTAEPIVQSEFSVFLQAEDYYILSIKEQLHSKFSVTFEANQMGAACDGESTSEI